MPIMELGPGPCEVTLNEDGRKTTIGFVWVTEESPSHYESYYVLFSPASVPVALPTVGDSPRAAQVGSDDKVPVLFRMLDKRLHGRDASVIDEDIGWREVVREVRERGLHRLRVGDVHGDGVGLATCIRDLGRERLEALDAPRCQHDPGACRSQCAREVRSQSARSACDQSAFSIEREHLLEERFLTQNKDLSLELKGEV